MEPESDRFEVNGLTIDDPKAIDSPEQRRLETLIRRADRRAFLRGACGAAFCLGGVTFAGENAEAAALPAHPARWYKKLSQKKIECQLCTKHCRVDNSERGFCGVRENHGGHYRSLVYGRPCTMNMDPIEKKPLFHMLPGTYTFSIATAGCNMDCKACQNWQISQARPEQIRSYTLPPARLTRLAASSGSKIISYTYTEPVIYLEYVIDSAVAARKKGLRNCMITGGLIERQPLDDALKVLDAVKVDLKSFSDATYRTMNKGELKPILRTIETVKKRGRWVEIVYLVIPTLNDRESEVRAMCTWVKRTLGADVPVHFTRFYPAYQLKKLPPTPISTLLRCFQIAKAEGLHFPYVGNVVGRGGEDTHCPKCRRAVVIRHGYTVRKNDLARTAGHCPHCKYRIPGIWK